MGNHQVVQALSVDIIERVSQHFVNSLTKQTQHASHELQIPHMTDWPGLKNLQILTIVEAIKTLIKLFTITSA